MGFTRIQSQSDHSASAGPLLVEWSPTDGFEADRWKRLLSIIVSSTIHLALIYFAVTKMVGTGEREDNAGSGSSIKLIELADAEDSSESPQTGAETMAAATKSGVEASLGTEVAAQPVEWHVSKLKVPVEQVASSGASVPEKATAGDAKPNPGALAKSGAAGGGSYDPYAYAGAAPLEQSINRYRNPASSAVSGPISSPKKLVLDQNELKLIVRDIISEKSKKSEKVIISVEVSGEGVVIGSAIVESSLSDIDTRNLSSALIGKKLYKDGAIAGKTSLETIIINM